ncbi:PREDICTED: E3 ubiquitin-protein ligase synoviolin B-like [Priapulus caudatus]|uniref:RING-type E3 ubiquitin transferase n=1 Tax=Priapulus caudatus TaxID=37621 RepID=A0ABM1DY27_PRICU|nr:PREDICTED: E3 ubiquitin-protein ligase synoviolin B-like [Priapulus caudatus]
MRLLFVTFGSIMLTSIVIGNAYHQKKQFYPSVVYLTKSNPSMAVLYVQALVFVVLAGKLLRKFFFGQLRAAEMEHLIERSWYAVTETCLAFTVFRDDFSPRFVAMFTLLLFLKCFHWLAEDRVDYMERSPIISWVFHIRVVSLLSLLGALDMYFVHHAYHSTLTKGASVQLVFGFEYAILLTVVINIFVKYVLHTIDLQSENPWDNKAVYLLYTDLMMGMTKVVLYMLFVVIMIKVHTFPLFVIRPMYLTIRAFKKALNDVIMSRRAIRNMNTLYPDATPEELQASDNVCIICREEMVSSCKKLPCNHIFHISCLRSWFQRQQTCPTCRMDILRSPATVAAAAAAAAAPGPQRAPAEPAAAQQQAVPQQLPQMFMGGFPMWPPMNHLQPAGAAGAAAGPPPGQQPEVRATEAEMPAGTSAPTTTSAGGATGASPSVPPPPGGGFIPGAPSMFGFTPNMFMPFGMMPPPPAPPSFAGLTDEELRRMEGQERQNVEARIQCLRNVQTLLDAAVLQLQQYTSVVGATSTASHITISQAPTFTSSMTNTTSNGGATTGTTQSSGVHLATGANTSAVHSSHEVSGDSEVSGKLPESVGATAAAAKVTANDVASDSSYVGEASASASAPSGGGEDKNEEVRRRRLQHFEAAPAAGGETDS